MYSYDVRKIIINMYFKLKSLRQVQILTNVSKSSISRWKCNIKYIKKNDNRIPVIIDTIKLISKINFSFTINDILLYLKNKLDIFCSYQLVRCVIKNKMNMSYKKTKYANFINEESLKYKTNLFHTQFKNTFDPNNYFIASIDEIGFSSDLNPIYSWSTKGQRTYVKNKLDNKNRKNKSVCSCITSDGNIRYNCSLLPYNKISFLEFLKSLDLPHNTIILMDNVSFHHSKDVISYIKNKGWILFFTPPYSPWFNPIENVFSMIKNHFRKNKSIEDSFNIVKKKHIFNIFNSTISNILNNVFLL